MAATVEELAEQTDMQFGQLDWTVDSNDTIAGYEGFREAAATVSEGDFPKIEQLDDGGLFAIRLDEALPERPAAYEDVTEQVATRWREDQIVTQLRVRANAAKTAAEAGDTFAELGLTERV